MNSGSEGDIMGTTIQSGFEGAIMSNLSEQAVSSRPNSTTPEAKAKQSARDKARYLRIKSDPAEWEKYRKRKNRELHARQTDRNSETIRKRKWRANNEAHALELRRSSHAVQAALANGLLVRPESCSKCGALGEVEAHHHLGYAPEHWLDVLWLCNLCHSREHYPISTQYGCSK